MRFPAYSDSTVYGMTTNSTEELYQTLVVQELTEAQATLSTFMANEENLIKIARAARFMADALQRENKIISCGNGGSHCDAMHLAEELTGRYRTDRPALAGLSISDTSHLSCVANDYGYEEVFSRFIQGIGRQGDVLVGLGTSGNSVNIIRAVNAARQQGMQIILLTGKDGGKLAAQADVEIRVPHTGFADRIQEVHGKVIHVLIFLIEQIMGFGPKHPEHTY